MGHGDRWRRPLRALGRVAHQPGRVVWLTAVWLGLWGRFTVLTAVSGLFVAVTVLALFPSPGPEPGGGAPRRRVRPARVCAESTRLVAGLVPGSLTVAWQMLRFGPATRAAVIAVPLRTRSEAVSVLVANAISLAPGAAVIHVDRDGGVFYVHALVGRGAGEVEKVRAQVDALQCRVAEALGYPVDGPARPGGR